MTAAILGGAGHPSRARSAARGDLIFRRRVVHPPLPERSFLRSALADMAPAIEAGLRAAVAEAIRK